MKEIKQISSGEIVRLVAHDQKGGEGLVTVGYFNDVKLLSSAVAVWEKAGGWKLEAHTIRLNRTVDPRTYYPNQRREK